MHLIKILAIVVTCGLTVSLAAISKPKNDQKEQQQDKAPWEIMEAVEAKFSIIDFNGTWISDNEFYYMDRNNSYRKFNAAYGNTSSLTGMDILRNDYLPAYISSDYTKILVRYDYIFENTHAFTARYDVIDLVSQKISTIRNSERLQLCTWSPSQNRIAYVFNNNVFIHIDEKEDIQLTTDGIKDVVFNGITDLVYGDEVVKETSALWWSNDGNFLAVGVYNDTNVGTLRRSLISRYEELEFPYPKEKLAKYPIAGTSNPIVALKVFNVSASPTYVTIKAPEELVSSDHILQNVVWTGDSKLLITWLNRRQNVSSLQLCSVAGTCHEILHIEEPKGWVEIGDFFCLKSKPHCLFTYWINNWYQIWNLNLETGENMWQSRGNFTVKKLYGYDELNDIVYYQANLNNSPTSYHVFGNDNCLTCNLTYEDGEKCLFAKAEFSISYSYYTASCLGPKPGFSKIFETRNNKEIKIWETNTEFRNNLQKKVLPIVSINKVPLADGSEGIAKLYLPPYLNRGKKYAMVIDALGAPNYVSVTDEFSVGLATYMATKYEVIYVQIDGRGSGNKGKDVLFSINNHLGEFEVEDKIHVTKYLQKRLTIVDKDRCGIWGDVDFSAYVAARALSEDNERVFKCGIAKSPITSLLHYNSICTERYMGLPAENLRNYSNSRIFKDVENFRNHEFLLMHGTDDDNVHIQHTLTLSKVLQSNNIMFQQMIYANEGRNLYGSFNHTYGIMDFGVIASSWILNKRNKYLIREHTLAVCASARKCNCHFLIYHYQCVLSF